MTNSEERRQGIQGAKSSQGSAGTTAEGTGEGSRIEKPERESPEPVSTTPSYKDKMKKKLSSRKSVKRLRR